LNLLGTLDLPSSGRVLIEGQDPARMNEPELAAFRNRKIGFVFQDHYLLPQCSVLENVLLPAIAGGPLDQQTARRGRELLDRVGLGGRLEHRPSELSGGEQQRAALARALLQRPVLLLADEPTGNLDQTTADRIAELLLEVQQQERTMLVVVTHSRRLAARMSRQMELDDGRLQQM
jgi:lipoprotein-releasing system ATP-binding protein